MIPPYAKLRIAVNAGAPQTGAIVVSPSDVLQFSAESTAGWSTAPQWQIYAYPAGWSTPSGWTADGHGNIVSTSITPTAITLPAPGGIWGKWLCRLIVNNSSIDELTGAGSPIAQLVDSATAFEILSANGLHDLANFEDTQFGTDWVTQHQTNLRTIDTKLSTGGGGTSYLAHGTITQYKAVASYTATQRQQATPTLLLNGAELVGVASATVLDGATVQYAKVGETITVSGLSGGVAGVVTLDATGGLVKGDWGGFIIGKVDASDRLSINPRAPSTRGNWFTYGAIPDSAGQAANNVTAWNAMMLAISPSGELHGTKIEIGQRVYVNAPLDVVRPVRLVGKSGAGNYDVGTSQGGGSIVWTVPTHGLFLAAPGWSTLDALGNAGLCRIENLELFGTAPATIKLWALDTLFTIGDYVRIPPNYKWWGSDPANKHNGLSGDPGFIFKVTTTGYSNDTDINTADGMSSTPILFGTITEVMSGTQTGAGKTGAVYHVESHAAILAVTVSRIDHCSMTGFDGCAVHLYGNGLGSPQSIVDESRVSHCWVYQNGGGIRLTASDSNGCTIHGNSIIGSGIGPGKSGVGMIDGSLGSTWTGNYADGGSGSSIISYGGSSTWLANGTENPLPDLFLGNARVWALNEAKYIADSGVHFDGILTSQSKWSTDNRVTGNPTTRVYLDDQAGTFFGLSVPSLDQDNAIRTQWINPYYTSSNGVGDWWVRGFGAAAGIQWSEGWGNLTTKDGAGLRWEPPGKFVGEIVNGPARRWWGWDGGATLSGSFSKWVRRGLRTVGDVWFTNPLAVAGDFLAKVTSVAGSHGVSFANLPAGLNVDRTIARQDADIVEGGDGNCYRITEVIATKGTTPTFNASTSSTHAPRAWTASSQVTATNGHAGSVTLGDYIRNSTASLYPAAFAWTPKASGTGTGADWAANQQYKAFDNIRSSSGLWFTLYALPYVNSVTPVGTVVTPSSNYQTLAASAARGTNSAAAGIDFGTKLSQNAKITATLDVTAKSGTSLTVSIDTSPDNSTWTPLASFTAVTVSTKRQTITATLPNRTVGTGHQWVRVSWLSDGFTFSVVCVVQHEKNKELYTLVGGASGAYTSDFAIAMGAEPDWSVPTATDSLSAYFDTGVSRFRHIIFKSSGTAEPYFHATKAVSPPMAGLTPTNTITYDGTYFYGVATTTKVQIQGFPTLGGQWLQFWPTTGTVEPAWDSAGAATPEVGTALTPDQTGFGLTWVNAGAEATSSRVQDSNGNWYTRYDVISSEARAFMVEDSVTRIEPRAYSEWGGNTIDGAAGPSPDLKVKGRLIGNWPAFTTDGTTVTSVGSGYTPPNNSAGRIDYMLLASQYSAGNSSGHVIDGTAVIHCHVAYQNIANVLTIGTPVVDTPDIVGTALSTVTATNATIAIVSGAIVPRVTGVAATTIKWSAERQNPEQT